MTPSFTFNPRQWTVGFGWNPKTRCLWFYLPMCRWFWPITFGKQCVNCRGEGGWYISAGGVEDWFDECDDCGGTGRIRS